MGMPVQFVSPNGRRSVCNPVCDPQLNLLAHGQLIELSMGSKCGGHGVCGSDRVRVRSLKKAPPKLSPWTESELRHLSTQERSEGWRLACQVFPETSEQDIEVEVNAWAID